MKKRKILYISMSIPYDNVPQEEKLSIIILMDLPMI